jgi:thiol-disulfide isomerase/thioredoxin
MTGLAAFWLLLLKPLLLKNKQSRTAFYALLRFKKNKELFLHLLANQKKVDATPFKQELIIGNPDAPLQIIAASNPYCNPCSKAHALLDELADQFNDQISISFRFLIDTTDVDKTAATTYIFQSLAAGDAMVSRQEKEKSTRKVLGDWFSEMQLEAFKKRYPLPFVPDVREQLNENSRWAFENNIDYTPAIFINGWQLPPQYTYSDLPLIVDGLLFGADPEQKTGMDYTPVFALEV